jgi:acetolactate synthase-1/2/3 large subunit
MKVAQYIAARLVEHGIRQVFMVTGGGAMHLNHALGTHPELNVVFNHHEQASAMAAEAYFRLTNRLAVVNVTSGPGGTNAITGVYGAWTDSIGMLVLSGQVKYETTVRASGLALRQFGDQELDIERLIQPITKYSAMVTDPSTIRYHLEKALFIATAGRPGPVWLDIPLNVQAAQIDSSKLVGFEPDEVDQPWQKTNLSDACNAILEKLTKAVRPVLFAGGGVRLSGSHAQFLEVADKLGIPVVTGWNAHDVIYNGHTHYVGRPGTLGDRAGNFTVQNADLLLILGSRLNIRQVSYNWENFARTAYKIWVDIDPLELQKKTVRADMPVVAHLGQLLPILAKADYPGPTQAHSDWLAWCKERQRCFPVVLPEYWENKKVNPYCFIDRLFSHLLEDQIVVAANGTACVVGFQAAIIKKGQRFFTNSGAASMGYDLPAAIGACMAAPHRTVVCLAGDGSIMMNLQELQTITSLGLPVKIFILNNSGYVSIFQTQKNFFNGEEVGAGPNSGVIMPDYKKISEAFNIPFQRCCNHEDLDKVIVQAFAVKGAAICEIMLDENQAFAPKLSSRQMPDGTMVSAPLEDMAPFLERALLVENMIIPIKD